MNYLELQVDSNAIRRLQLAVQSKDNVQGLTHNYYKYPARFSPKFVREVIEAFSEPGDVILDPFVGGGTTLVEALATNRHSIGFDVSPIASFVSKSKTTLLSDNDLDIISNWFDYVLKKRIIETPSPTNFYMEEGYLINLPWTIRKSIEVFLTELEFLRSAEQRQFAKCVLLKTSQWAIDCRKTIPTAVDFRNRISQNLRILINGVRELIRVVSQHGTPPKCICINSSSEFIKGSTEFYSLTSKPKLVITSPPYVGVHMLYHQWQVQSRRRTRTPFWIIDSLDGQGSPYYTFGHYQSHGKKTYFEIAERSFNSIHSVIDDDAIVVQLVGFSNHRKYLPKYLEMMRNAGYDEMSLMQDKMDRIKRIWRNVPNRKWYAMSKNENSAGKEVLLIHKKTHPTHDYKHTSGAF
jgi:hypothetical protein